MGVRLWTTNLSAADSVRSLVARMMGRNLRRGCSCFDCQGPKNNERGRAYEKREWMKEIERSYNDRLRDEGYEEPTEANASA